MDRKVIMSDLKEIRYYYLRRSAMEEAEHTFRTNLLVVKVRKYAEVNGKSSYPVVRFICSDNCAECFSDEIGRRMELFSAHHSLVGIEIV